MMQWCKSAKANEGSWQTLQNLQHRCYLMSYLHCYRYCYCYCYLHCYCYCYYYLHCYLTSCLPSDLTRLASKHCTLRSHFSLFTCTLKKSLHAHWRKAWGRKPLQSEAVQCKAKAPPTKADEIFPEFVEISSRQNLHSFPALGKLIILAGGSCSCKRHKDETIYQKVMTLLGCKKTGENFLYLCTRSL